MIAYEKVALRDKPDWIVVVGDVNSTAACAMVGSKLWIPVVHLEAGLRSGDRRMPEEFNRLVTGAICDVYWTPSPDADEHLAREGVPESKIDRVGNIMIDSFEMMRGAIEADGTRASMGLEAGRYAVVTLHRSSNVDTREALEPLVNQLVQVSKDLPLVFAVHQRTRKKLDEFGLAAALTRSAQITLTEPLGYIQFMNLVHTATAVITDSGGVQEESTYLGIPCLTLRENTERPITVSEGSNRMVKPADLYAQAQEVLGGRGGRAASGAVGWQDSGALRCGVAEEGGGPIAPSQPTASATPSTRAARARLTSSVASGRPRLIASSRYAASYVVRPCCAASGHASVSARPGVSGSTSIGSAPQRHDGRARLFGRQATPAQAGQQSIADLEVKVRRRPGRFVTQALDDLPSGIVALVPEHPR